MGATGDNGMRTKASYFLQWHVIQWLKQVNCTEYDLHGVNQEQNPGVYSFKAGLCARNGKELDFVGVFDAYGSRRAYLAARAADVGLERLADIKAFFRRCRRFWNSAPVESNPLPSAETR